MKCCSYFFLPTPIRLASVPADSISHSMIKATEYRWAKSDFRLANKLIILIRCMCQNSNYVTDQWIQMRNSLRQTRTKVIHVRL